jgi:hypothetical protein
MPQRDDIDHGRRAMLLRLGLAATAIYTAPVLVQLSGAKASSFSTVSFSPPRARQPAPEREAPPEIVVTAPRSAEIDLIAAQGYSLLSRDRLALIGADIARFGVPAGLTLEQARAQILDLVPAAGVDLNHVYEPGEFGCGEDGCAAFDMIGWQTAAAACPAGTALGMIDTGVNTGHAALAGVDVSTVQVIADDRDPASALHGTAIAVLLAGRRDTRTPGLLEGVRLLAAEAFHRDSRGRDMADSFDIARAIDRLAGEGIRIINLSFAGPENAVLHRVVQAAREREIVLVAAAGNAGPNADPLYPAAFEEVVAVTAVDRHAEVYRQAAQGAHIDFAAPGVRLWTAASISGGRFQSGTSYAAPFVTAALAVARSREPEKPVAELIDELAGHAVDLGAPGRDPVFGFGLVQSDGACGDREASVGPLPTIAGMKF